MATWTEPTTRVPDEVIDDDEWNSEIVENLKFLYRPPACNVGCSSPQPTTSGAPATPVDMDATGLLRDMTHSNSVNSSIVFIVKDGFIRVDVAGVWETNSAGQRYLAIYKNGSGQRGQWVKACDGEATYNNFSIGQLQVVEGDEIEVWAAQDSGSPLGVTVNLELTFVGGP